MAEHIIDKIKYGDEVYKFQDNVSGYITQEDLPDTSNFMVKGTDYVTAGQKSGTTLGDRATAEGNNTTASGDYAHAEGSSTIASRINSHAEGSGTTASSAASHAEGFSTTASGHSSHAEGYHTQATTYYAHSEGNYTEATGTASHAEGSYTKANSKSQHVFGEYNIADSNATTGSRGTYVEIVGNGTSSTRSNARTLDWSGNEVLAGKLTVGAAPTANMDVATKQYVDTIPRTWYGISSTASGTAAKVVTCADYTLVKGSIIGVLFAMANTVATPTLNVNSTGAKSIYIGTTAPNATTNVLKWSANTILYFMYDGIYYRYITSVAAAEVAQPRGANTWYGTSSTATATAAKTSTISNYVLTKGSMVTITFSTANTVANKLTLNINATGAKDIWYNNLVTSATNPLYWAADDVLTFIYDGTRYMCVNSPRQDNGIIRSTADPTNASSYPADTIWIKYGADPMATMGDYITDTGTSGIWTYRKWNSGIAECWGRKGSQNYNMTTISGNGYYSSAGETVALPAGLFTSITSATSDRCGGTTENGLVSTNIRSVSNNQLAYFVWNTVSGTLNVDIAFMVKGRWKE